MAAPQRNPADLVALAGRLSRGATGLSFFPLVALLERLLPGAAQVGGAGPVLEEAVRFKHDPALSFSAGEVASVELKQTAADPEDFRAVARAYFEVTTAFLGLTGSGTPLPYYLAEEIAQEDIEKPHRREFLDLFHHRLLALLYRVQAKYDLTREHAVDGTDPWSRRVLALAGIDRYDGTPEGPFPVATLLRLSPLLARRARTPRTLEVALEDLLAEVLEGGQVRVREFVGGWSAIDPSQRTSLGRSHTQLGSTAMLGAKVFDRGASFEVALGPVRHADYLQFLPGGALSERVEAAVNLFGRDAPEPVLRVLLREDQVPRMRLLAGMKQAGLGRDTWLGGRAGKETWVTVPPERKRG